MFKECNCANGVAATGAVCDSHGDKTCVSCHPGYALDGDACARTQPTPAEVRQSYIDCREQCDCEQCDCEQCEQCDVCGARTTWRNGACHLGGEVGDAVQPTPEELKRLYLDDLDCTTLNPVSDTVALCGTGTRWNGKACVDPTPPAPVNIYKEDTSCYGVSSGGLIGPSNNCEEAYASIYNATSPTAHNYDDGQSTHNYDDGCYVIGGELYHSLLTTEDNAVPIDRNPCVGSSNCQSLCKLTCLPGYYQDQTGQSGCKECPAGYSQAARGQTSCEACANGQYSLDGSANCVGSDTINHAYSICDVQDVPNIGNGWQKSFETGDCSISNAIVSSIYDRDSCAYVYEQVTGSSLTSGHTVGHANAADLGCIYDGDGEELKVANPDEWDGQEFCSFVCLPGYYQDDADGRSCKECPAGYSQAEKEKNHCQSCENGKYSLAGSAKCVSGSDIKKAYPEASTACSTV